MRSRSTAVLSVLAASGLLLAGCASGQPAAAPEATSTVNVVESSITEPAAVGERVGVDGTQLEVWSGIVPDDAAAGALGDPEPGTRWVTANVAQWVSVEGLTGAELAPVLRSTADESFEGSGSTFTSTIEGCSSGTVSNGPFRIGGGPGTDFGKFNGFKAFECADGGGFVVHLLAKFDEEGSTGTWAIYDGTLRP